MELYDYLKIARKIISKYGPSLLRDEDAVAYVANYIIKADIKYDGKTGSKEGFRCLSARYAIKNWINRNIKNKPKSISIDADGGNGSPIKDKIDSFESTTDNVELNEILDFIDTLNENEQKVLKMYYFESMSLKEIGQSLNLTHEAIRQRIKKALCKIKEKFVYD